VTIWRNVAFDDPRRHTAMLDGYQPGDPVVRVFACQASPGRPAEEIAAEAFAILNDHPVDAAGAELGCAYYGRRLRSLSAGDIVAVGEVPLAVASAGWTSCAAHSTNPAPAGTAPALCPCRPRPAAPVPIPPRRSAAMSVVESRDYQAARDRIKGNPIIATMAASVVIVPLTELADEDGTPRPPPDEPGQPWLR
jgi:hypothetical protein